MHHPSYALDFRNLKSFCYFFSLHVWELLLKIEFIRPIGLNYVKLLKTITKT
jgi:hypothetical protein